MKYILLFASFLFLSAVFQPLFSEIGGNMNITPIGMDSNGQFVIANPGDIIMNTTQPDWNATSGLGKILNEPTIVNMTPATSALSLSLVGSGATGTQISATKPSFIACSVSTSTTSTIGGASTSLVALKICSTNNATEGSWTTVATIENDQTISLAIVLQSLQVIKGQLCSALPAAWYAKLVNSGTGTHSEVSISGQQTVYG